MSHLGGWVNAENKVQFARDHMMEMYQLYYRVMDVGGYWYVLGNGLWDYFDKEVITASKDIYENYLFYIDPKLQEEQANWPLWKLKRTVMIPFFSFPSKPKPLRSLLFLSCFLFRFLPSIHDLSSWCLSALHMSILTTPYEASLSPESPFQLSTDFPVVCLNAGICVCISEVECEDGRIAYGYHYPGDVMVVQKGKIRVRCAEAGEGKVKWLQGVLPNAPRLIAILETAISEQHLSQMSTCSAVFDLLQRDISPTLSLSNQAVLAERLLSELTDFPLYGLTEFVEVPVAVCGLCHRSLFCLGRQCSCELVVCKRCRYLSHACNQPYWSWVKVTGFRDVRLVRDVLSSIQKRHMQTIPRN